MKTPRWIKISIFLLSAAISIVWASSYSWTRYGTTDFRAVYYGTRCLLQHHNPYNVSELERVVADENGERPSEILQQHQAVTLYVNLPSTFLFVVPFAILPFGIAQILWISVIAFLCLLSSYLIWNLGETYAPGLSLFLVCIVLANSEVLFGGGNTAGIAVPLCVLGAWCFLREQFVTAGVVCMAVSLAIKPHDSGFVWLYFLLLGGIQKKRAMQVLGGAAVLGITSILWVWAVAPDWISNWRANLALISRHGYINDPTPESIVGFVNFGPVIDLQSIVSIFRDDPRVYNSVSYMVCGVLLLIWAIRSLKTCYSLDRALLALAAVVPLTMLITYHRPWDAKLLLLTIPACTLMWSYGGFKRWIAFLITFAALLLTGDIPMAVEMILLEKMHLPTSGLIGHLSTIFLLRPIPVVLLIMAIFYTWIYARNTEFFRIPDRPLKPLAESSAVEVSH